MAVKLKQLGLLLVALVLAGCAPGTGTATGDEQPTTSGQGYQQSRQDMVQIVRDWGIEDELVLEALSEVPRHEFVPARYQDQAYANHPLPIGFGQTISQPVIVGMMSAELNVEPGEKVLEIGTGSGYQAAVLAEMGLEVYSVEIIPELAEQARATLADAGYQSVEVRVGDGYFGWEEQAPFDAIIVTAAPDHVPQPLIEQLKVDGRLLIPIGPPGGYQELWRITRTSEDQTERTSLGGVRFVPLLRDQPSE